MIFTADCHIHNYEPFAVPTDIPGINSRAQHCLSAFEAALFNAYSSKSSCIFAGDLFVPRNSLDVPLVNALYHLLVRYGEQLDGVLHQQIYIVPGNHDRYSKAGNIFVTELFGAIPGITVVSRPSVFKVYNPFDKNKYSVGMAPCRDSIPLLMDDIKTLGKQDILVAHTPIFHARTNKGFVFGEDEGMGSKILSKQFRWAFFGDEHTHQKIRERFYVIGAPLQHTFGDEGTKRGYLKFLGDKVEHVDLGYPRFHTVVGMDIGINEQRNIPYGDFIKYVSHRLLTHAERKRIKRVYGPHTAIQEIIISATKKGRLANNISDIGSPEKIFKRYLAFQAKNNPLTYNNIALDADRLLSILVGEVNARGGEG